MNKIKDNIDFLKNIVQKRETYIRFSPLGTAFMGIMYIIYYFFGLDLCSMDSGLGMHICSVNLFVLIGIIGVIIVTVLSLFNSSNKGEELLPKSIRYIIVNLIFTGIAFFSIVFYVEGIFFYMVPIVFLFYGLLIIVSRFCIPKSIQYFGYIVFLTGVLLLGPLFDYLKEIILVVFGLGHLIVAAFLKINNDKNG